MEITKMKENFINITEIVFHKNSPFILNIQTWLTKDINIEMLLLKTIFTMRYTSTSPLHTLQIVKMPN